MPPLASTPAEERANMWKNYVFPLMGFSLEQEATVGG